MYYNMGRSWKSSSKWKKPVTKDHTLYESIYMSKSVETESR